MNTNAFLHTFSGNSECAVRWVTQCLTAAGLRVVRSFDLQSACASFTDNTCPHHGASHCDCQLVVLLVYGAEVTPASLILHNHRDKTEIQLDEAPEAGYSRDLIDHIRLVVLDKAGSTLHLKKAYDPNG